MKATEMQSEKVDYSRLLWAGPLAIFGSAILTVLMRELAALLGIVPQDHALLGVAPVFFATVVQVAIGVAVFALIGKCARRPITTFRIVAIIALLLSLTNPILAATGVFVPPVSGNLIFNPAIVVLMMLMHIVAGVFTIGVLTTQSRKL